MSLRTPSGRLPELHNSDSKVFRPNPCYFGPVLTLFYVANGGSVYPVASTDFGIVARVPRDCESILGGQLCHAVHFSSAGSVSDHHVDDVVSTCPCLQMPRIDAEWVIASMPNNQTFGNFFVKKFVRYAVRPGSDPAPRKNAVRHLRNLYFAFPQPAVGSTVLDRHL